MGIKVQGIKTHTIVVFGDEVFTYWAQPHWRSLVLRLTQ